MARITGITLVCLFSYRSWVPAALLAVSIAWSLAWIGTFLGGTEIFAPHAIGYWAMIVSVGVVLAGAIAVWRSARTGLSEQQQQPTV
jgi:predicted RND superfamily exporter protein